MSEKYILMISHGNVEDENEGHFIHANNVAKAFSNFMKVKVLEYSYDSELVIVDGIEYKHINVFKKECKIFKYIGKVFSFNPFSILRTEFSAIVKLFRDREEIRKSDAIIIQGALLIAPMFICKIFGKRIILDTHWINYDVAMSKKNINFWAGLIRKYVWYMIEFVFFHMATYILVVSVKDLNSIIRNFLVSKEKIVVIPQVVDFEKKKVTDENNDFTPSQDKVIITFIGTLKSLQNQTAVKFIEEKLAPKFSNCLFLIVGAEKFECKKNVYYLKFRKNIYSILESSSILISPVDVGSGVKFKMLDYLYSRRPIIVTENNLDGLPNVLNFDGVFISSLDGFSKALESAIGERIYLKEYEYNRKYVLENHSLNSLTKTMKSFMQTLSK